MFDDKVTVTESSTPAKRREVLTDKEYEQYKRECKALEKRLWELKEAAHREGMRYLTQEEFDEMWADERAGGEGFNRLWNY
ncbi:MAG: hypothetical protein LBR23_06515 [Spirochaetaceae bacterium]|jgi:hypothetical protein|nr:hypothetical protein [Spirochaetaceae bacterium]